MQDDKETIDREILLRYLNGAGTKQDRQIIQQWLDNSQTEKDIIEESITYWNSIDTEKDIRGYDGDLILGRIYHKIKIEEGTFIKGTKPKIGFIRYLSRIAAIIIIPLFLSSLFLFFQNRSFRNSVSWAEIHAPFGTRTDFSLPDGSRGQLNGGSSLKFPVRFNGSTRDVELTGEAYFDVVSDKKRPLIVSAGNIEVKVTGTSFNVMAYSDEENMEVTLKTGRVEVLKVKDGRKSSLGILKPDEVLIYNSLSDTGKIQHVNTSDKLAWLDGKLTFKYEPFGEVIKKLNRWYNANIIIKDNSLDSYIYYGTFQNETLDEVLKLLHYTAPIKYIDFMREKKKDGAYEKRKIEIYSIR